MSTPLTLSSSKLARLFALAGIALCMQAPLVRAQNRVNEHSFDAVVALDRTKPLKLLQRGQAAVGAYILGPGDGLEIELLDLPELSGRFSIGPDGNLYLPRLRSLYVEGLTIEELRNYLTQQFGTYVLNPQVYIHPVIFRPIRIYVKGEVKRPGYYTVSGARSKTFSSLSPSTRSDFKTSSLITSDTSTGILSSNFPTVFDAIRTAQGITPYSDLSQVQVIRKRSEGQGGGHIRTNLNFLSSIIEGNESQNIRLFDGDVVSVSKSDVVLKEQLLQAGQTNLSPQFIEVFVSGCVQKPGGFTLPQGSSLNQAIAMAGGADLIKGKVEFVRFTQDGKTNRSIFNYNPAAPTGTAKNPLLTSGDIIKIQDSILSATTTILEEITAPAVGVYTIFSLF